MNTSKLISITVVGMQKYVEILESHEVDVDTLVTMDDHDLKEIGISTFGKLLLNKLNIVDKIDKK